MFEIRLTPLPSTFNVPGVVASPAADTSTEVPPSIAALPAGTLIKGFVLNRDSAGNPVLRTPQGDFLVQSKVFLKIGSDVTVKVDAGGRNFHASIISVDGHVPTAAGVQNPLEEIADQVIRSTLTAPKESGQASRAASAALPSQTLLSRPTFSGTLLTPSPALTQASIANQLPFGSQLRLTLLETLLPAPILAQALLKKPPPFSAGIASKEGDVAEAPAGESHEEAVTPNKYAAYGKPSFQPAAQGNADAALKATHPSIINAIRAFLQSPQGNPLSLLANVVGTEPTGEPLLQTVLGLVRLNTHSPLPLGTQLSVSATLAPPESLLAAQSLVDPLVAALFSGNWPSLDEMISALGADGKTDPAALLASRLPVVVAEDLSQSRLFKPNAQNFAASLLFFFASVKNGDSRQVLSQKLIQKLESMGLGNLVKAFGENFAQMHQAYVDSLSQPWQSFYFPIADASGAETARFFFRRGKKQTGDDPDEPPHDVSRFVVEIAPSALGQMQLDGLVQWQEGAPTGNTRFDLIIRTHSTLPEEATQEILAIYHNTGELTGYVGRLQFQVAEEFPVHPQAETEGGHGEIMV